jgi:hypothetical protein
MTVAASGRLPSGTTPVGRRTSTITRAVWAEDVATDARMNSADNSAVRRARIENDRTICVPEGGGMKTREIEV